MGKNGRPVFEIWAPGGGAHVYPCSGFYNLWEGGQKCRWVNIHWEMMCTKLRGNRTRTGA